jgi:hypothetical protein
LPEPLQISWEDALTVYVEKREIIAHHGTVEFAWNKPTSPVPRIDA